jgi:SET domain-containing protein
MNLPKENSQSYLRDKYRKYFNISNPYNCLHNSKRYSEIYIKESKIHGFGVFAHKDFEEGEVITRYPAHYIYKLNQYPIHRITDRIPDDTNDGRDYGMNLDDGVFIIANPKFKDDMTLIGHICNDGFRHDFQTDDENNRNEYNKKSKEYNNSMFLENHNSIINIVSTKKIKKYEEILVPYGFRYWLNKNTN